MTKLIQPLKWPGGKRYLADWIVSHTPPHLHYVEPYFGGGAVLLARDPNRDWFIDEAWKLQNGDKVPADLRGCSEVVNDINFELTNFWKVLADPDDFEELQRQIDSTPFSQVEWIESDSGEQIPQPLASWAQVERAVAFFVLARQSMGGRRDRFTPLTRNRTRGGRNAEANAWWNCIEGLPEVHKRLRGVVILNDDALNVIHQQDGDKTLFYCDPPYLHEARISTTEYGEHEMTPEQHEELLKVLVGIEGKFQLSGYHSDMYDNFAATHGWRCEEKRIDNKASSKKRKDVKTECLWMNY